jgi:sec-independent protein translocase protein TatB
MFDLGWGKIVIIAVIALVVIGPKELPAVLRTVGQWMGKIRRMAAEFQSQFQEAMREAEMADLKKSIDAITDATRGIGTGFDPLSSVTKDLENTFKETPATAASDVAPTPAVDAPAATEPAATAAAQAPTPTTEPSVAAEPPVTIEPPPVPPPEPAAPAESSAPAAPAPSPTTDAGRAA